MPKTSKRTPEKTSGKKGMTGKILTVIISLVIALVALILLWGFLQKAAPLITQSVENMISGFKEMICEKMALKDICKWLLGA